MTLLETNVTGMTRHLANRSDDSSLTSAVVCTGRKAISSWTITVLTRHFMTIAGRIIGSQVKETSKTSSGSFLCHINGSEQRGKSLSAQANLRRETVSSIVKKFVLSTKAIQATTLEHVATCALSVRDAS